MELLKLADVQVPEHVRPQYLATLFLILLRLAAKQGTVAKVRASMAELLKFLAGRADWPSVTVEDAERVAAVVSRLFCHLYRSTRLETSTLQYRVKLRNRRRV